MFGIKTIKPLIFMMKLLILKLQHGTHNVDNCMQVNKWQGLNFVCPQPTEDYRPDPTEDSLMFPRRTGLREATLLLLKEKCGRYTQLRVSSDLNFRNGYIKNVLG
jgi:hypothetical protein